MKKGRFYPLGEVTKIHMTDIWGLHRGKWVDMKELEFLPQKGI